MKHIHGIRSNLWAGHLMEMRGTINSEEMDALFEVYKSIFIPT